MATQPRPIQFESTEKSNGDIKPLEYLSAFKQLGPQVYFYHPVLSSKHNGDETSENLSTSRGPTSVPEPNLIIICSWMAAAPRHIAKYTNAYLAKYPHIPTLLVRSSQRNIMLKPEQDQLEEIKTAISAIQSVFASQTDEPRVLMHIFSNGGCWSARLLSTAYPRAAFGLPLPITALVLDSCPSLPHMRLSHLALSAALPKAFIIRLLGSALIWVFLCLMRILDQLHITSNLMINVRNTLNDPKGSFIKNGVPRVYICSKTDAMVPLDDVKLHAEEAEALMRRMGLDEHETRQRVRFEEFHGSPHVSHLMVDKERYWKMIGEVWERGIGQQKSRLEHLKR